MKKHMGTKGFTVAVFIIVFIVGVYYVMLSNRSGERQNSEPATEKDKLLTYNFEENYPKTVREAVKLHCRYMKCAYNNGFTEDELFTVNQQVRKLFDDDLLAINTEEDQLKALKSEIEYYQENKQKYVSYSLAESSQVEYNTTGGRDYAKIKVGIMLRANSATVKGDQEYILRKDSEGRWKILGWEAVVKDGANEENE